MTEKIDIRAELYTLSGHLRSNRIIDAYDLLKKMSAQMDEEYFNNPKLEIEGVLKQISNTLIDASQALRIADTLLEKWSPQAPKTLQQYRQEIRDTQCTLDDLLAKYVRPVPIS